MKHSDLYRKIMFAKQHPIGKKRWGINSKKDFFLVIEKKYSVCRERSSFIILPIGFGVESVMCWGQFAKKLFAWNLMKCPDL